jgi:Uma2 family endonuclease
MGEPASKRATYDDVVRLPEHLVGEIVDGELHASPRPAPRHSVASSVLGGTLSGPFHRGRGGPGGWWILDEPELHLGADVLVPDLAGWRRERMPVVPKEAHFTIPPDWVGEVLSPSTARLDRARKLPAYARHGVAFLWLVDPLARTVEVMRLEREKWVLLTVAEGEQVVRLPPFDAIELELAALWDVEPSAP